MDTENVDCESEVRYKQLVKQLENLNYMKHYTSIYKVEQIVEQLLENKK